MICRDDIQVTTGLIDIAIVIFICFPEFIFIYYFGGGEESKHQANNRNTPSLIGRPISPYVCVKPVKHNHSQRHKDASHDSRKAALRRGVLPRLHHLALRGDCQSANVNI